MKLRSFIFCMLLVNFLSAQNFSNKGKEFWVGYGHNQLFNAQGLNKQDMVLYLSADLPANVTVSINGTSWVKTYSIPANTAIPSDLMPKAGADDCRIRAEGLYGRAIHIVSDVPIVAYVHTYGVYSSGGTMLLPVESYSYTYFSVNPEQNSSESYSWFYVVAAEDNTKVRITPSRPTAGGRLQNTPFTVTLKKGELYNVMGKVNGNSSYDLSGSKIQSLPGADGVCHPVAVFSGSSRTYICPGDPFNSGSDYVMQQVFPVNAWGSKYITALTSRSTSPSVLNNNKFRIYIREPNTQVRKNGIIMTGLANNFYYDYISSTADVITSTKPVLMAQFIPSANGCGAEGLGDPEMFILSPVEQAIKNIVFYNTDKEVIVVNYLTMIIADKGVSSLLIDGSNHFDYTYPHPNAAGYTVVVKQLPLSPMQHTAKSDSAFTAITYGLGEFETYGYNAGTNLRNLESEVQIKNIHGTGPTGYTCPNTPFHAVFKTIYKPSAIFWRLSGVKGLSPNADVLLSNYPVPTDSVIEYQRKFYLYELPGNYTFDSTGVYNIGVTLTDLLIENCSYSTHLNIPVNVIAGPDVDFTMDATRCANNNIVFNGISAAAIAGNKWQWSFGENSIDSVQQATKAYPLAGSYSVQLRVVRNDGCIALIEKPVIIHPLPLVGFKLKDSVICMPGGIASFENESKAAGGSALQFEWNFGDNTSSSLQDPGHYFASGGSYSVKLLATVAGSGCKDSATHIVNGFTTKPVAGFDPGIIKACADATITFNDNSSSALDIFSRQWFADNNLFSTDTNPSKKFTHAGNYELKLIVKDNKGCTDTVLKSLQVYALPLVDAGADKFTTPGIRVQLDGSIDNPLTSFAWSPPGTLSSFTAIKPEAAPSESQLYYLTATNSNNCTAKDSVLVQVLTKLYVPNAFTPNGDGLNDTWMIPALKAYGNASVLIFNRYGQKIFESHNYNSPWDGYFKGNPLPGGSYCYIIDTHTQAGGQMKGFVVLIR